MRILFISLIHENGLEQLYNSIQNIVHIIFTSARSKLSYSGLMQFPRSMQCILTKGKEPTGAEFHKYRINHLQVQSKSMILQNISPNMVNDFRALTHYDPSEVPCMATLQPNTLIQLYHSRSVWSNISNREDLLHWNFAICSSWYISWCHYHCWPILYIRIDKLWFTFLTIHWITTFENL